MIQALNMPYSSKRDEIMSRYRPIAPKPELSNTNNGGIEAQLVPEKFRQSPYLRDIWSHLQARPTRTRKRGRTAGISPAAAAAMLRNQQHHRHYQQQQQQEKMLGFMGLHARNPNIFHACGIYGGDQHASHNNVDDNNLGKNNSNESIVELPLLSTTPLLSGESKGKSIDLNAIDGVNVFEEKDYLSLKLQIPTSITTVITTTSNVISPRPVRPVGSTISIVGPIGEDPEAGPIARKSAEKVEEEVEIETLPAVISDRGNKVRMVNSAYKELIGQPECPWLDTMVSSRSGSRISGEVMIRFVPGKPVPGDRNGFSCWVRIEWESEGEKKYVNAFSEVRRVACESKDYLYYWRFNTREVSPSGSNV